ncbi:MAG: universal stress protein [Dissulfurispiraceae bacterium]|jgi:nucleotide-binding universal stress UspA family protein
MDRKKTILAAVDLGAGTEKVLSYSLWLSRAVADGACDITMLNVMDYALTPPAYLLPYLGKEEEAGGIELDKWVDRLKPFGVTATGRIAVGRLVETFNKTIHEFPVAALVLGHKSHLIRTSSSERLIKSLNAPMLVVRGKKADGAVLGAVGVKKILCAVDFSAHSKKALESACSLAEKNSSALLITHILSSLELDKSFGSLRNLSEEDKQNYKSHAIQEAEKAICSPAISCGSAERIVRIGVPYKTINEIASERDTDLIVIGARGESSTTGVLLGSIAEAIIKSSPCPVMLVC